MKISFQWHSYTYFPYEKSLAQRELEVLFKQKPTKLKNGLAVQVDGDWITKAKQVTYFCEVLSEDGQRIVPFQSLMEASSNGGIQEIGPGNYATPSLKRQSTRYSSHGLHEYRGKFNPQIVRAIGNILNLEPNHWVLDPFCGSGTTLLEAAQIGWNAIGMDINPLGVEIARAKVALVRIEKQSLVEASERLKSSLERIAENQVFVSSFSKQQINEIGGVRWQQNLPNLNYLRAWFTESVLVQISAILREIDNLPNIAAQPIFRVILSNILREVSLQDPADLRIRRVKLPSENAPAIPLFIKALTSRIETILKARHFLYESAVSAVSIDALLGDTRDCASLISSIYPNIRFDAAITSPPYVSALPYIDTQRLSLAVLGLIDATDIRSKEKP